MLMFQQIRLRERSRSSSTAARSMWLTGSGGRAQLRRLQPVAVDLELVVQVQEAGAGPREVAAHRRQQRHRAHHVAAGRLALQALTHPQQRRPRAVAAGGLLDGRRGHAGCLRPPGRRARLDQRLQLVPADAVAIEQRAVGQSVADDHVQHRERQRGIAAGERLQVQVGPLGGGRAHRVDHDHPAGRLRQPVVVGVRRRRRRVRAPHQDAGGVGARCAGQSRSPRCRTGSRGRRGRPCCRPSRDRPRSHPADGTGGRRSCRRSASRCRCSGR